MLLLPRTRSLALLLLSLWLCVRAAAWICEPNPHEGRRLVIVPPSGFTDAAGKPAPVEKIAGEYFGAAVKVTGPVASTLAVKFPGKYQLWVRVLEGKPLAVELAAGTKTVLKGDINDGPGAPGKGGKAAFEAYRNAAVERNPEGGKDPGDALLDGGDAGIGGFLDELNLDTNPELKWINATRIEPVNQHAPYYWWKVGEVELAPGNYALRAGGGPGSLNAALLTTATELTYPFGGDIDIPPASYIRFRVDALPRGGLNLSASMRIHANPHFATGTGYFAPDRMLEKPGDPIKETGYTAWYRLQDLEHAPGFGGGVGHLIIDLPAGAKGATQFAVFPHGDQVLREFAWDEPEGRHISLLTDFKTYLHKLRTFRDHAREHYEYALSGSAGRLFPLTRGPLYFQPNGGAQGIPGDYAEKALRLLGINLAARPRDTDTQRRFSFKAQSHGETPAYMPYDPDKSRVQFIKQFENLGNTLDEQTVIFQLADEPGEFGTLAMSAPLWRFYGDEQHGPRWVDHVGGSELVTKRMDYQNCVLEGKVVKNSSGVGFKVVGLDKDGRQQDYVDWWLGTIPWSDNNMRVSRDGKPVSTMKKPEAVISNSAPTPFKVILDGNSAAVLLNGKLLYYFDKVPSPAGFTIYGPEKTLTELTLRSPRKDERNFTEPEMADPGLDIAVDLGDLGDEIEPWTTTKPLEQFVKEDWQFTGGEPEAQAGFRQWLQGYGVKPELFGKKSWDEVSMMTVKELAETPEAKRLYYWSRKYSGYLTPKLFAQAAEGVRAAAPNKNIWAFVGLSGHSLYFPSQMPMDMFQLAQYDNGLMPGVSDFMSLGGWRWDSHQSVAFSVAPFNGGARRYGAEFGKAPVSFPMMHCGWPNVIRAFTQIANNVKYQSYWAHGPEYNMTEWYWSESPECYEAVASIANHSALVDDVLATGYMRASRVAMLFAMSSEYWGGQTAFTDKRATFLGLSHEYFQPDLVNEDQLAGDALSHYDALYVLDPYVSAPAQAKIEAFVKNGGILWTQADAFTKDEYDAPSDFLQRVAGLHRTFTGEQRDWTLTPAAGETAIHRQTVPASGMDKVAWDGAKVRASFGDGRPAWLEKTVGKGKIVYLAFRGGHHYSGKAIRPGGVHDIWSDIAREPLALPLHEAKVARELIVDQPSIMASPLTNENGTVIVLYNMQGATAKDLRFSLREAQKPVSVQYYTTDMKLVDLPFEYQEGRAVFTLPELPRENMILLRGKPAPPDDRLEEMRRNAVDLLERDNWEDISTGAWYAGFYPEWKMADALLPLLAHEHFMVRRQAAESLGRLGHAPASDALAARIAQETDAHALGDMLYALAQLNDPRFPQLAQAQMSGSTQPHVRKQTMRGAALYLGQVRDAGKLDEKLQAFGAALFALADADLDLRVYGEAAPVLALADPERALELWKDSYSSGDTRHRDNLSDAVATTPALLDAALQNLPADPHALLALAARRQDPRLAKLLAGRLDTLADANPNALFHAAGRQADPALSTLIFAKRKDLPDPLKPLVLVIMERTFNARLGNIDEAWEEYLKK